MYSTLITFALLAAPALAEFAINSPKVTQCQEVPITWEKTKPPYNLLVVDAKNPCEKIVADLGDHNGTSFKWKVALPDSFELQFTVEDGNGDEAWSQVLTVQPSNDNSCLPAGVKPSSSSTKASTQTGTAAGSTIVVTPTTTVDAVVPQTTNSDSTPDPVGAAGAGPLNQNGAITVRQASTPALIVTALAAVMALSF